MGSKCSSVDSDKNARTSATSSTRTSTSKGSHDHHRKSKKGDGLPVPDLNKTKFQDEYRTGRAHSTKVTEVKNNITMQIFASYKLPKSLFPCKNGEEISKRIKKLQEIEHPNVCRLIEAFDDYGCLYIIYQNVGGKTIVDEINNTKFMSEQKAADVGRQIIRALNCASTNGLIHGSLVPKNILVQPAGGIIVTDVGLIDLVKQDEITKANKASFSFLAPELLRPWYELQKSHPDALKGFKMIPLDPEDKTKKSAPNDIWSVGAILFFLLTGHPPFMGKFAVNVAKGVIEEDAKVSTSMKKVSNDAQTLISSMLSKKAADRPTAEALLKDKWLMEKNKDKISNEPLDKEIFANFASLKKETHFKKFLMKMVATNLPPKKVRELEKNFNKADLDGDGFISLEELRKFVKQNPDMAQMGLTAEEAEHAFHEVDTDGGGKISLNEFIAATIDSQQVMVESALRDAWKAIDSNHDGKITKKEMQAVVTEVDGKLGKEHIKELQKMINSEVHGELTFEDFCALATEEGAREERHADDRCYSLLSPCRNLTSKG
mmetsp:Transcript_147298/g.270533  ORF Transcript_147298/g.270533 Transcript_147298/m.270533 type:complete len:547 (-) Transcript_147298:30-1670(-)